MASTPAELKAIAEECQEFASDFQHGLTMTYAPGGESLKRCDLCIHWQGGMCDIYKDEREG